MIVADTNLVAYLLIAGERTEAARAAYARDSYWRLPTLWRSEFLNVLVTSVRCDVLDEPQAQSAWTAAVSVFAGNEALPRGEVVLKTALRYGISAYDAQFVVAAESLDIALVTGDRGLARACPRRAVWLEDFAAVAGGR